MKRHFKLFLGSGFFVLLNSCATDPVEVEFAEMMNNNTLGRFEVENNTEQDVMKISFEVTYVDGFGEDLSIDTVSYNKTSDSDGNVKPFLDAKSSTFFVWEAPENAVSARGRVLSYD